MIIRIKSCKFSNHNTEMHVISHGHLQRDNICPPLFSPMASFSIEPNETKSVDREFLSIDTKLKFNHQRIN